MPRRMGSLWYLSTACRVESPMRSTRGVGGKPIVVGGGASVVATVAAAVDGATVGGAGASVSIVEVGEPVATDVVELAPTVALEPTAAGAE
jgi:hypothetical protein